MKKSTQAKKQPGIRPVPAPQPQARSPLTRWLVLAGCLILAGGATWAFLEFVVWNNLPSQLVGNWEVIQGPPEYNEAVFEFHRSGKMIGHFNDHGNLRVMYAVVHVDGDKFYITTRQPSTGKEHVSLQTIRTLNDREFIVADERGRVMKMTRIP